MFSETAFLRSTESRPLCLKPDAYINHRLFNVDLHRLSTTNIGVSHDCLVLSAPVDKYIIAADINEQLTKASRHFAELLALARELKRTVVLPDAGEGEFGLQRAAPFCKYGDAQKLGEYVDWVTLEQFVYETRKKQGAKISQDDATRAVAEMRQTAEFLAFNETHPVTHYPYYFEGLVAEEWKQLGVAKKPSGAALVLRQREDFCGMRIRPWLWHRMGQLAEVDRVVCVDEPRYDKIDEAEAFRRMLEEVRSLKKEPDVLFVVKSRSFDAFAPKEMIEQGLKYLQVTPKVSGKSIKELCFDFRGVVVDSGNKERCHGCQDGKSFCARCNDKQSKMACKWRSICESDDQT